MASKAKTGKARFINPAFPLKIGGGVKVAVKKNPATRTTTARKSHHKKRNPAGVSSVTRTVARRANPARRSNPARRRNPSSSLGGLSIMKLAAAAIAATVCQTISNAVQIGAPGSLVQTGVQLGLAVGVHKFWPKKFEREAATIGAATPAVVSLVNKLVPNLTSQLSSFTNSLVPAGLFPAAVVAATPPPASQAALSGLVAVDSRGVIGRNLSGLVNVPKNSMLNAGQQANYYGG